MTFTVFADCSKRRERARRGSRRCGWYSHIAVFLKLKHDKREGFGGSTRQVSGLVGFAHKLIRNKSTNKRTKKATNEPTNHPSNQSINPIN